MCGGLFLALVSENPFFPKIAQGETMSAQQKFIVITTKIPLEIISAVLQYTKPNNLMFYFYYSTTGNALLIYAS